MSHRRDRLARRSRPPLTERPAAGPGLGLVYHGAESPTLLTGDYGRFACQGFLNGRSMTSALRGQFKTSQSSRAEEVAGRTPFAPGTLIGGILERACGALFRAAVRRS